MLSFTSPDVLTRVFIIYYPAEHIDEVDSHCTGVMTFTFTRYTTIGIRINWQIVYISRCLFDAIYIDRYYIGFYTAEWEACRIDYSVIITIAEAG